MEGPGPWDLYHCLEDGRKRKAPLRTYTASREVGRTIGETRERLKNVVHNADWEVVRVWVNHAGELQEAPVIHGESAARIESCPGHRVRTPWDEPIHCMPPSGPPRAVRRGGRARSAVPGR